MSLGDAAIVALGLLSATLLVLTVLCAVAEWLER